MRIKIARPRDYEIYALSEALKDSTRLYIVTKLIGNAYDCTHINAFLFAMDK